MRLQHLRLGAGLAALYFNFFFALYCFRPPCRESAADMGLKRIVAETLKFFKPMRRLRCRTDSGAVRGMFMAARREIKYKLTTAVECQIF